MFCPKIIFHNCKEQGHRHQVCKKITEDPEKELNKTAKSDCYRSTTCTLKALSIIRNLHAATDWIVDSGASTHITNSTANMENI